MRVPKFLCILSLVLPLAGCGNMSSNPSMPSAASGPAPTVMGVGKQINGVATDRLIDVQFSTAMDPATINTGTFLLQQTSNGATVSGAVTYNASNFVAVFKPSSPLAVDTAYSATVTTGAADAQGVHLGANYAFSFTTRDSGDSSPIRVFATLPTNGQTDVSVDTDVRVVFTEGADPSTVNTQTFMVKDDSGNSVAGTVKYDIVTNRAVFKPSAALTAGITYTVTIAGVKDMAGEPMAAPYKFSFTTTPGPDQGGELVYESNQTDGTISGYIFDSNTGKLTSAPGSPYSSGVQPYQMVVSPSRDFLYAVMGQQPPGVHGANCLDINTQVISYAIDHNSGALTQVQQISLNGFCAFTGLAIDPAGHFLYVGETDSTDSAGMIDVLSLGNTGKMTLVSGSPFMSPQTPTALVVVGNFIYAANNNTSGTDGLLIFQRDPSAGTVKFLSGMTMAPQESLDVSAVSGDLYSVGVSSKVISDFKVNASTGALTLNSTVKLGANGVHIAISPLGFFATVAAGNGVNVYSIAMDGSLTPVAASPFDGGATWVMYDTTGAFFVALQSKVQIYGQSGETVVPVASAPRTNAATVTMVTD